MKTTIESKEIKKNKYEYEVILQQNNGYGWDDIETFQTNSTYNLGKIKKAELVYLKKEYKIAQANAPLRTIHRKTLKK